MRTFPCLGVGFSGYGKPGGEQALFGERRCTSVLALPEQRPADWVAHNRHVCLTVLKAQSLKSRRQQGQESFLSLPASGDCWQSSAVLGL